MVLVIAPFAIAVARFVDVTGPVRSPMDVTVPALPVTDVWSPVLVPLDVPLNVPDWAANVPSPKLVRDVAALDTSAKLFDGRR
jgi:hypothetical protein